MTNTIYLVNSCRTGAEEENYYGTSVEALAAFKTRLHYDIVEGLQHLAKKEGALSLETFESPYTLEQIKDTSNSELQDEIFDYRNTHGTLVLITIKYSDLDFRKNEDTYIEGYFGAVKDVLDSVIWNATRGDEADFGNKINKWTSDIWKAKETENLAIWASDIAKIEDEVYKAFNEEEI